MAELPPTNLERLTPSRRKLVAGDVFVAKPRLHPYLFGRVISTDHALNPGSILVYLYDSWSEDKRAVPELDRDRLLIPPAMTNRLGWSRGYFEFVAHRPLRSTDKLLVHCFESHIYADGPRYFDEQDQPLSSPIPPFGQRGLGNYRTIDDAISRALGLELAPDT